MGYGSEEFMVIFGVDDMVSGIGIGGGPKRGDGGFFGRGEFELITVKLATVLLDPVDFLTAPGTPKVVIGRDASIFLSFFAFGNQKVLPELACVISGV